ncbi:N-acetylmuramoyl-L-alanine amidase [Pseudanabaena biceps]|nr:N-acetylmuramoyl-L-alanine amidase [Pseudanabaena biceps]
MRYRQLAVGILISLATSYGISINDRLQAQTTNIRQVQTSGSIIVNGIRATPTGLMLSVSGNPQIQTQREVNPDRLILDLQDTSVVKNLHQASLPINRFGIKQVRVAQYNPAIARLVFDLDSSNPDSKIAWNSQYIAATRTLILTPSNQTQTSQPIPINTPNPITTPAVVERLSFSSNGRLLIAASQPVGYQARIDAAAGTYNVLIPNATISPNLQRPTLAANNPIERIRLSQVGNSVEVAVKAIAGWQVREPQRPINRASTQQIELQVSLNRVASGNQTTTPINNSTIPAPQNVGDRRRGLIFIDAGHGGNDPGAVANGIQEKDVVLPISLKLGQALQSMGYTVYYTRTNDVEIDLEPRVAAAERVNADVFVSIHANSLAPGNSGISGVETYHSRTSTVGRELASYVHSQVISGTGASDRSVRGAGFYVIAKTSMPAILVETGFVTNPTEARNLDNPSYQKLMADAIARGVDQFMKVRGR